MPGASSALSRLSHPGEVACPRGLSPLVEAGRRGACHERPDLCVAMDNYSPLISCQADGPSRALQRIAGCLSRPINLPRAG